MDGDKSVIVCRYATDTGRPWCNCPVRCTEIECRNAARLSALQPGAEGRNDGAAFHSKYEDSNADRRTAEFILVRSRFCCEEHCVDFSFKENDLTT